MPRFLALVLAALLTSTALADVLLMKDGRRIEGTIKKETASEVVIDTRLGTMTLPRSQIRTIEKGATPRQEFDARWKKSKSVEDFFALGKWAAEAKLRGEAKKCMKEVVKLEAQHAGANEWLGNVQYKGEWMKPKERDARKLADEAADMRKRGLVKHGDGYVTIAEKEKLDQGLTYFEGRWLTETELKKAQGFVLHDGEWIAAERATAYTHSEKVLTEIGHSRALILTGANVSIAGPFDDAFLDPILQALEAGRARFDAVLGTEPGLELIGGRLAEFYVYDRDSSPYIEATDYLASLSPTVPPGWAEAVKKTHGFLYWDPFCVSSARVKGRPLEDLAGHCYHHWGHLLINRTGYDGKLMPPWFDEGFASLFEFASHGRNAVFCVAHQPGYDAGGATSTKHVEFTFSTKEFRKGTWAQALVRALEEKDTRISNFDKLAQKQVGDLNMIDIAMGMAITLWLEKVNEGALRRFHDTLRKSAPPAPQRVILKGIDRQGRYDAAFQAAVQLNWREADKAWRTWFLENMNAALKKRPKKRGR